MASSVAVYLDDKKTKPIYGRLNAAKSYNPVEFNSEKVDPTLAKWLAAQSAYLQSDPRRKAIAKAYTFYGDVLANSYLRRSLDSPDEILSKIRRDKLLIPFAYQIYDHYNFLVKQGLAMPERDTLIAKDGTIQSAAMFGVFDANFDFFLRMPILNKLVKDYSTELYSIILNSPKAEQDITVYRGRKSEQSLEPGILRFKGDSFISTSLNVNSAVGFTAGYGKARCCLYEILIRKKTPCLYINDVSRVENEFEILLPYNTVFVHSPEILQFRHDSDTILVRTISTRGITERPLEPTYMRLAGGTRRKVRRSRRSRRKPPT